jgi:hypothetical protein
MFQEQQWLSQLQARSFQAFLQEVKSYLQIYRHPKPIQLLIAKGQLNESQTYLILHESNGINMI